MDKKSIYLPTARQTVRIIPGNDAGSDTELYAVVDVITLDGKVKLFCLEDLKAFSIQENSSIFLEYGYQDALYRSTWKVNYVEYARKKGDEEIPSLLLLSPVYNEKRIQRRKYFRLAVKLPVRYKLVVFPPDFVSNFQLRFEMVQLWIIEKKTFPHFGETVDISEGGICFLTASSLKKNDELALEIQLPDESFVLPAIVMWSSFAQIGTRVLQKVGIQFVCEHQQEKKKIRDFISEEQRRQLQEKKKKKLFNS